MTRFALAAALSVAALLAAGQAALAVSPTTAKSVALGCQASPIGWSYGRGYRYVIVNTSGQTIRRGATFVVSYVEKGQLQHRTTAAYRDMAPNARYVTTLRGPVASCKAAWTIKIDPHRAEPRVGKLDPKTPVKNAPTTREGARS